jgi:hypothetical protein
MTFPATHNINYYKGDTYEFNVYPRTSTDSDGDGVNDVFPLTGYSVDFAIAERRGTLLSTEEAPLAGYAVFAPNRTHIQCAITPINGADLDPTKTYVYDVTIAKTDATTYDKVFTLLSGNLTVQDKVESPEQSVISIPGAPLNVVADGSVSNSLTLSWDPPTSGGAPDGYYVYVLDYSPAYEDTTVLQQLVDSLSLATPTTVTETTATFTETTPTAILPSNPIVDGGQYLYAIVSFNTSGSADAVGNFDIDAGTVDEVTVSGGV